MSEDRTFDPKKKNKLNNPLRLNWVPPARIAQIMGLKDGEEYIDLGAGTGYMSRAIGALVNAPVVHAIDIEPLMVTEMEESLSDISWIKPALMERDRLPFADNSIDGLWCITVFHEFGSAEAILKEIHRVLKPGGSLLVIDWLKKSEACEQGPPLDHRVAEGDVMDHLKNVNFTDVSSADGFIHHFAVMARKS